MVIGIELLFLCQKHHSGQLIPGSRSALLSFLHNLSHCGKKHKQDHTQRPSPLKSLPCNNKKTIGNKAARSGKGDAPSSCGIAFFPSIRYTAIMLVATLP
jgi:hypothetical protein